MWTFQETSKQYSEEMKIDGAFRKIKQNHVCFFIWKIENDRVDPVPRDKFGIFYDYNTYIIYAAAPKEHSVQSDIITRESKSNVQLHRFIHFWLGANTTAEQSANVAYKVIELDNFTGNTATQYREAQSNESCRFYSYFKDGINILTKSNNLNGKLFEIKGKKSISCTQRTPIDWSHFNSKYVMLLQTDNYVFVWFGRASSCTERKNALKIAHRIQETEKIMNIGIVDDGYEQTMDDAKKLNWNRYLNLAQRVVNPIISKESTIVPPNLLLKLYKCGFTNGKYRIEEIKSNQIYQSDLDDDQMAFIIDGGLPHGVWIWLGKHSHRKDKSEAMRNARGFVKKKKYPSHTPVIRIIEQFEPMEFINLFPTWQNDETIKSTIKPAANVLGKVDTLILLQRPKLASASQLIDDGSGEMVIYRVHNDTLYEIPKQKNMSLFSKDCFLIHYIVSLPDNNLIGPQKSHVKHLLYLWIGRECSIDSKSYGQGLATELAQHLGKNVMQIRLNEGTESPHFLQIFNGKLIIFAGQCIDNDPIGHYIKHPNSYMLRIIGDSTFNSKAIQMSDNSVFTPKDCLIVKSLNDVWVWCGQCSTGDTREIAKSIGSIIGEYTLVLETNETKEFWQCLPMNFKNIFRESYMKPELTSNSKLKGREIKKKIGFYVCSYEHDRIDFSQVLSFTQNDLMPEDIYLLDIGNFVYIWIGSLSSIIEKENCWKTAKYYLANHQFTRNEDSPIAVIHQGYEPNTFVGHFPDWNVNHWENYKTLDMYRQSIECTIRRSFSSGLDKNETANGIDCEFDQYPKYPIDVLRSESTQLPEGVDPKRKEVYLTNDDFVAVFQMSFDDFEALPNWKKQQMKKNHKLF